MTKRRWLKSAIEEAKKTEVSLPWQTRGFRVDPVVIAAAKTATQRANA